MNYKFISLLLSISILSSACSVNPVVENTFSGVTQFSTATLLPSTLPEITQTLMPPTQNPIAPAVAPAIEGTTTTQINVRSQTSTASESLGIIDQFRKVQIIGRDATDNWYQIIYPSSNIGRGWIRAEYVQLANPVEIQAVSDPTDYGPGVSGLVTQKIFVRKGPATSFDSVGVLNPKDIVFIKGKDSSGEWMQIIFANSPDGTGWVALEYLKADGVNSLPVINKILASPTFPENTVSTPSSMATLAMADGDSMASPLVSGLFSPFTSRILQVNSDVSAPEGDNEDWIKFAANNGIIILQLQCLGDGMSVELWNKTIIENGFSLSCGEKKPVKIEPNNDYYLHLFEAATNTPHYTRYSLRLEALH